VDDFRRNQWPTFSGIGGRFGPESVVDLGRIMQQNGLPREMLYQLAFYASSQGCPGRATILYPTAVAAQETWLEISQPVSGEAIGRVILRPVDLIHLESLIRSGTSREQAAFAGQLALGAIHSPLNPC
jgi:hypothetical protein